ncbi:MAG TPA: bifunctional nicotinamidase/pyrazinamidase [Stellaceae bacterium]|nr:bifunctional nicotinamidase/pyrazinamidase [Stellaceae bacterium]
MSKIAIQRATDILGLIDIQPTFMPGGELPVPDGAAVVPIANRLMERCFDHAFATQDWHPPGHSSFASSHPGKQPFETIALSYGEQTLWPDHGLQGSAGAALHPDLRPAKIELVVRKGFRPGIDSYSAFFENDRKTSTGLAGYLRERGFQRIFLAGLATDFCVAFSAEDAADLGFEALVIEDACRGIGMPAGAGATTIDAARIRLLAKGVRFVSSGDLA